MLLGSLRNGSLRDFRYLYRRAKKEIVTNSLVIFEQKLTLLYLIVFRYLRDNRQKSALAEAVTHLFKSPPMFANQFMQLNLQYVDRVVQVLDSIRVPGNSLVVDVPAQVLQ